MASTKLSHSPSYGGPPRSRSISRTNEILLETMQYIAQRKEQPVPNRLLESKIYSKLTQNGVVQARPSVIHFAGFEPGKTCKQVLRLANVSTEVQRMHIIPPQTKYFYIKYTKGDRLVSGLTLDCTIEFTPDEWRYYYDCIRIHSKGDENIIIPIHAYPVMSTADFPEGISFPSVPVGYQKTKTIPLRCHAPIDFEYQLSFLQHHPAFRVEPMSGVVPANGEIELSVTFAPTEFVTAYARIQLVVSQFNAKPLVCTITGSSKPGLAKEISENSYLKEQESQALELERMSPIDMVRKKRRGKKEKTGSFEASFIKPPEIERDGIRFPSNLDTPYAVAQVLNQQPGKLRVKDLREVAKNQKKGPSTRQMKEAVFEQSIRQDVYEERQNQLRWQVKLGENQITPKARAAIFQSREESWTEYKFNRGDPLPDEEYHRRSNECLFRRTVRESSKIAEEGMKFDSYSNDMWSVRHAALDRFTQAARKVIMRIRANKKLVFLRQMILDWGKKKYTTSAVSAEHKEKLVEPVEAESEESEHILSAGRVSSITFPTYSPPDVKDDMAVDVLGAVPFKPTQVIVKKNVPYHSLKVPQLYKLNGYSAHSVHSAASGYVSPNLSRPLRVGAEEEIISLPTSNLPPPKPVGMMNEGDLVVEDVTEDSTQTKPSEQLSLLPPEALFKPIDYPALHIFNPAPGLQVFQAPLPYAEVDPDFHLCPLPCYTCQQSSSGNPHTMTQKRYLDREDVIRGVMTWKKFPSQGLTSLSNTPTLTNVWVPRWSEPFGSDLLPYDVPDLYESLPESERINLAEDQEASEEEEDGMSLTPEMVNAEFALIDPSVTPEEKPKDDMFPHSNKMPPTNIPVSVNGPVPREKREKELDFFLNKKYNKLGTKIENRLKHMDNLKTNHNLRLE